MARLPVVLTLSGIIWGVTVGAGLQVQVPTVVSTPTVDTGGRHGSMEAPATAATPFSATISSLVFICGAISGQSYSTLHRQPGVPCREWVTDAHGPCGPPPPLKWLPNPMAGPSPACSCTVTDGTSPPISLQGTAAVPSSSSILFILFFSQTS